MTSEAALPGSAPSKLATDAAADAAASGIVAIPPKVGETQLQVKVELPGSAKMEENRGKRNTNSRSRCTDSYFININVFAAASDRF